MSAPRREEGPPGLVYLVGAGPGDPGLLTRRAARLLRRADLVIHDALVGPGILRLVARSAEIIDAGKRCGGRHTSQERINEILVSAARSGRTVVRLKGGDPFVFGRGGEEALALAEAGIPFEVVPGVTAAVGVSAYAGIPLTHRGLASSVTFATGHEDRGRDPSRVDWDALARVEGTLVVYMGVGSLASTAERLMRGGRSSSTPAAVVEWGTHTRQRTVAGPLGEIASLARAASIGAPALVVIGGVVGLRERLSWFERKPLRGFRILLARSRAQSSVLARMFRGAGAEVRQYPRLRAAPLSDSLSLVAAFERLSTHDWLVFTAPAAVTHFWRAARRRALDARAFGGICVASFGAATSSALRGIGIEPDLAARTFDPTSAGALMDAIRPVASASVLFPRDARGSSPIGEALRDRGALVSEVEVCRLLPAAPPAPETLLDMDLVVLPSSNAARAFVEAIQPGSLQAPVLAIGPATAATARSLGLNVPHVATRHTFDGVLEAAHALLACGTVPAEVDTGAGAELASRTAT